MRSFVRGGGRACEDAETREYVSASPQNLPPSPSLRPALTTRLYQTSEVRTFPSSQRECRAVETTFSLIFPSPTGLPNSAAHSRLLFTVQTAHYAAKKDLEAHTSALRTAEHVYETATKRAADQKWSSTAQQRQKSTGRVYKEEQEHVQEAAVRVESLARAEKWLVRFSPYSPLPAYTRLPSFRR